MKAHHIIILVLLISLLSLFLGYQVATSVNNINKQTKPDYAKAEPKPTPTLTVTQPYPSNPEWNQLYTPVFSIQYPLSMASLVFTSDDSSDSRVLNKQTDIPTNIRTPDDTMAVSLDIEQLIQSQMQCGHQNKNRVSIGIEEFDRIFYATKEKPDMNNFFDPNSTFRTTLPTQGGGGGNSTKRYSNAIINNANGLKIETIWTNTIECDEGTAVEYVFLLPEQPDKVLRVEYFSKQPGDEKIPEEILSTLLLRVSY